MVKLSTFGGDRMIWSDEEIDANKSQNYML